MSNCPCCGQNARAEARPTVKVDDALLALCNDAYALAVEWRSGEVCIAHLAFCLARHRPSRHDIEASGYTYEGLARRAEQTARPPSRVQAKHPLTSDDLKTLLARAETRALRERRNCAAPSDALHVLFKQSADLASAAFLKAGAPTHNAVDVGDRRQEPEIAFAVARGGTARVQPARLADMAPAFADRRTSQNATEPRYGTVVELQPRPTTPSPASELKVRIDVLAEAQRKDLGALTGRLDGQDRATAELRVLVRALSEQMARLAPRPANDGRIDQHERQLAELSRALRTLGSQVAERGEPETMFRRTAEQHQRQLDALHGSVRDLAERLAQRESDHDRGRQHERQLDDLRRQLDAMSERMLGLTGREADDDRHAHHERRITELRDMLGAASAQMLARDGHERDDTRHAEHQRRLDDLQRTSAAFAAQIAALTAQLSEALDHNRELADALAERDARLAAVEASTSSLSKAASRGRSSRNKRSHRRATARRRSRRLLSRLRMRMRRRFRMRRSRRIGSPTKIGSGPALQPTKLASLPLEPAAFEEDDTAAASREDDEGDEAQAGSGEREKRFYLSLDDEIEKAPSIGPRTAIGLAASQIYLVRDLLACDPKQVAARSTSRYVSAERIAAWKSQARLVCMVPWLRGTHAQLLVGAGYDTLDKLAKADAASVCAAILRFAATHDGQRVLRSGNPPDLERVRKWMANVELAEPQRAA